MCELKFIDALKYSVTVNVPVFTNLKLAQTNFIKDPQTQFRENSTNGLSTDDRSQTDCKERLKVRCEVDLCCPGGILSTE